VASGPKETRNTHPYKKNSLELTYVCNHITKMSHAENCLLIPNLNVVSKNWCSNKIGVNDNVF